VLTAEAARWVLVLHTALGAAAVGAATHLVLWLRRVARGEHGRLPAARRFARIVLVLQLLGLAAGNLMYPTYKVEVRAAYLEDHEAIATQAADHARQLARVAARDRVPAPEATATSDLVRRAAHAARWFDIKEHWIALGVIAQLALVLIVSFWDPRAAGRELAPLVVGLAVVVAGTLWLAALIGVTTAAWRAV
jgi:hypothetical protein